MDQVVIKSHLPQTASRSKYLHCVRQKDSVVNSGSVLRNANSLNRRSSAKAQHSTHRLGILSHWPLRLHIFMKRKKWHGGYWQAMPYILPKVETLRFYRGNAMLHQLVHSNQSAPLASWPGVQWRGTRINWALRMFGTKGRCWLVSRLKPWNISWRFVLRFYEQQWQPEWDDSLSSSEINEFEMICKYQSIFLYQFDDFWKEPWR